MSTNMTGAISKQTAVEGNEISGIGTGGVSESEK